MPMNRVAAPLLALSRPAKRAVVVTLDLMLCLVSVWLAFYLRVDQTGLPENDQVYVYLLAPALAVTLFIRFGLYRAIFRYTGMAAMLTTAKAVGLYTAIFFGALLLLRLQGVPRTLGLIQPLLFLLLVGSSRAMARFWLAGLAGRLLGAEGRMLIYGAGEAGVQTASALGLTRQYMFLGFIDDDAAKVGRSINGVNIMSPQEVPAAIERLGITDILLAMPGLERGMRNEIIAQLRPLPVHVRTLPGMSDLASGRVTVQDFQELDAEDLLGRAPVPPDSSLLARNLAGKVVLVSGAGGSIGSELCRQILNEKPSHLVLVDHSEYALYTIHQELIAKLKAEQVERIQHGNAVKEEAESGLDCKGGVRVADVCLIPLLASVGNFSRLKEICLQYKPATVYHAAAYKHVPLVESNPAEGVFNNIFGTLNMARAAMESGAAHFVLISTDKAVRPTNVMGATKRMAELVLQALAASPRLRFTAPDGTHSAEVVNKTLFAMVRFGNVLDSSGSVVPLFRKQLASGGPLTVTHPEVTRYFMTIPEAAQLVLQAGAMAVGGDVFVLDMGQPVKIIDLARRMTELAGFSVKDSSNPQGDLAIEIVGLRPGEKLYEELLIGNNPEPTAHQRIMKAHEDFVPWAQLSPLLVEMRRAASHSDEAAIRDILKQLVDGFGPVALESEAVLSS